MVQYMPSETPKTWRVENYENYQKQLRTMLKPANSEEEFFAQLEASIAIELNLKKAIGDMYPLRNIALKGQAHPEWLDLKPKQRVMRKPAYAALIKMGKHPKSIKNYQDFKRALDNARK